MEFKQILADLIPAQMRSTLLDCQNGLRYYIRLHQSNVEKLDIAENAEAKKCIILAEEKMLEISEKQKEVLKQMHAIIDDYCQKLKARGTPFDKELMYGIVNRLISIHLERTVAIDRQKQNSLAKISAGKLNGVKVEGIHSSELPKPKNFKRALNNKNYLPLPPTKIESSPKVNNSRMNLLEALKKAAEESACKTEKDDDDEKASEDTGSELSFSELKPDPEPVPHTDTEPDNDVQFLGAVEYTPSIERARRKRKLAQPILVDADGMISESIIQLDSSNSSESSGKSSRRNSDVEELPKQEVDITNLGQNKYLRYFNLLTHDELKVYQSRRTSRRKRNCTSTNRKDFHYGSYDIDYQPIRIHSNKPQLFSPSKSKRKPLPPPPPPPPPMQPIVMPEPQVTKRPRLQPIAVTIERQELPDQPAKITLKPAIPSVSRRAGKVPPNRDLKPCITCGRLEDVEKMNACLICYNFYHLTCHTTTMQRELRERENMCPGCLKRIVEKKKRQLELKKLLKVQVLQANHKARVLQDQKLVQQV